MSWEWRSFMQLEGLDKVALAKEEALTFTGKKRTDIEERSDLYLFLSSFETDKIANYGIKFRDVQEAEDGIFKSNRLELKIRYSRDEEGREVWDKIVSQKLTKKCQLLKITNQISESPLEETKAGDNKSAGYTIYYSNIVKALEEVFVARPLYKTGPEESYFQKTMSEMKSCPSLTFYLVPKRRIQSGSGESKKEVVFGSCIKLEAKALEDQMSLPVSKICHFRSICVEGSEEITSESIETLKKEQLDYKATIIAGYPEFLLQL